MPDEPAVDGAESKFAAFGALSSAGDVIQQPCDLGAAEIRIQNEAGALSHQTLGPGLSQFIAQRRSAPVLPDDGVVQRLTAVPVPNNRGFTLVRNAYCHQLIEPDARSAHYFAGYFALGNEDLLWVMLNPPGLRIDLSKLALGYAPGISLFVKEYGARAGGALVESEYVTHEKIIFMPL